MDWLAANLPATERICVTHNDFRFDNVVLASDDPTRVIGVLDWELATFGDPLMDLGNTLAYWVQADDDVVFRSFRRQPTHLPGMLTRRGGPGLLLRTHRVRAEQLGLLRGLRAVPPVRDRAADLLPLLPPADPQPRVQELLGHGQLPALPVQTDHAERVRVGGRQTAGAKTTPAGGRLGYTHRMASVADAARRRAREAVRAMSPAERMALALESG